MKSLNGKNLEIQGSGNQLRSFIHVNDVCSAIDYIYQYGSIGEIYNIGSNTEISILELAKKINEKIKSLGYKDSEISFVEDRHFNDQRYNINYDKIEKLGWI